MNEEKTNFFDLVYQVVRLIPEGRVSTYGAIASYLGSKGSARMVGWAMNAAHQHKNIPAHRVVNRQGLLTGKFHFADNNRMQQLLEEEGVIVVNDRVQDFEKHFWDPCQNLQI